MTTPHDSNEFVDQIFVDDRIDHQQLKVFLKLISRRVHNQEVAVSSAPDEEIEKIPEGPSQIDHLSELIRKFEDRLAKLADTPPKTRIVIRNEGEKLQSIIDSVKGIRLTICDLRAKIVELSAAQKTLQKTKCDRMQPHPDTVDRLHSDADICNFRRIYYSMQNQVDELSVKCKSIEKSVEELQGKTILIERVPILENQLNTLLDWRESLREEFNLFAERYEHVKTVKAGKTEVHELLENKVSYCHLSKYVQRDTFNAAQQNFINELKELKNFVCELQLNFGARLVALHKDVQMVLSRLASKRRI